MIDLENDNILTLSQAANFLPKLEGKKVAISTIWRWCRKGVRGVKLEHAIIGSRIVTSVQALNGFVSGLSELPIGGPHGIESAVVRGKCCKGAMQQFELFEQRLNVS